MENYDSFYFLANPKLYEDYKKVKRVCKLWRRIVRELVPYRKHILLHAAKENELKKISKFVSRSNSSRKKNTIYLSSSKSISNASDFHSSLYPILDKFGPRISSLFIEKVAPPVIPEIIKKCPNLEQLVVVGLCLWEGNLSIQSSSLKNIHLENFHGLNTVHLDCKNLINVTANFRNCILGTELKMRVKSEATMNVNISGVQTDNFLLTLENLKTANIKMEDCHAMLFRLTSSTIKNAILVHCRINSLSLHSSEIQNMQVSKVKRLKKISLHASYATMKALNDGLQNVKTASVRFSDIK